MASNSIEHIEITPGICGGKPRIAGHRITVQNIVVWHEQMGMSQTRSQRRIQASPWLTSMRPWRIITTTAKRFDGK